MYIYTTGQWVLLFFFYCFCGWVWESCYVSVLKRRWVNRGFLQGPLPPLYGSGAIIILVATLPVKENLLLIWLFGMLAATILEYITGAAMEKIFKVRYWDYSNQKFQLNGHICLSSSIAWGFFSILMVRVIHPPIGDVLEMIPAWVVDPLALLITAVFTVDCVRSVQAALDLKDVLIRLTEEHENLRRLAMRAEVTAAFAEDDLRKFRERTELEKLLLQMRIEEKREELQESRDLRKIRRQERMEASLRRITSAKLDMLDAIDEALENCRDHLSDMGELTGDLLEERKADLNDAIERVQDYRRKIRMRTVKTYQRSLRILHANPSAIAKEFSEAMETLRNVDKEK